MPNNLEGQKGSRIFTYNIKIIKVMSYNKGKKVKSKSRNRIFEIGVFYKNNQTKGFGFIIPKPKNNIIQALEYLHKGACQQPNREELIVGLIEQLEQYSSYSPEQREELGFKMKMIMAANVYTLEQWGAITSDEYTGVTFMKTNF